MRALRLPRARAALPPPQQDDIYYSQQLLEGCQGLAARVLGVFPAMQRARCGPAPAHHARLPVRTPLPAHAHAHARRWPACREVRLLAALLYHGLTTGAGLQTLGEEYCNLVQVAGEARGRAGGAR